MSPVGAPLENKDGSIVVDMLGNFTQGRWWTAPGGRTVADAVTGEPICMVSSDGLDAGAVVDYAREAGGPALRDLGFAGRAALAKDLALALKARREELIELSFRTGATRADASVDVDGGIGTALVFASRALAELPASNIWLEGAPERLSKAGTFAGQHILTPLTGVAVEINAYNFPVWGMLEKLIPALIAGVPSIVKPATQTAYVTERAVRILDDSGLLPNGAVQLICGALGDVMDHLGGQDLVSFTGSAGTASLLRSHACVTGRSTRFNAEADSLNASILGPDALPGTPEFDLFVDALVFELTCKAGQRCTAIRRAFVPAATIDAVQAHVVEALAHVVIGAPEDDAVTLGALAGQEQRDDCLAAIAQIGLTSTLVTGGTAPEHVRGADPAVGAFLLPTLLRCDDPAAEEPHSVEAFGPVTTLITYRSSEELRSLIARGEGSLVASVVSHDPDFVLSTVTAIAAFHGRVLVLDRDCAAESTGHGTPMPQLVHGGPGRAGGGEEEGGLRAIAHYCQRTAIQGSTRTLERLAPSVD